MIGTWCREVAQFLQLPWFYIWNVCADQLFGICNIYICNISIFREKKKKILDIKKNVRDAMFVSISIPINLHCCFGFRILILEYKYLLLLSDVKIVCFKMFVVCAMIGVKNKVKAIYHKFFRIHVDLLLRFTIVRISQLHLPSTYPVRIEPPAFTLNIPCPHWTCCIYPSSPTLYCKLKQLCFYP